MTQQPTDIFGLPVPSTDKFFLAIVVIHILIALVAVVSGLFAMLVNKTSTRHPFFGTVYFWSMWLSFFCIVILSIMRWPHNGHLLGIGILAIGFTYGGNRMTKAKNKNWSRFHTIYMGSSYIFLLTGFYVDNGKNLPFWKLFPQWFFWIFPALVGIPIIVYALWKNPLNRTRP
jgi:hypothetical protein